MTKEGCNQHYARRKEGHIDHDGKTKSSKIMHIDIDVRKILEKGEKKIKNKTKINKELGLGFQENTSCIGNNKTNFEPLFDCETTEKSSPHWVVGL
jgi:hypothetical protein